MVNLAERTQRIDSSGIRKVFALAADMTDPVNLSIGQPHFDVPDSIKEVAVKAIHSGHSAPSGTIAGRLPKTRDQRGRCHCHLRRLRRHFAEFLGLAE